MSTATLKTQLKENGQAPQAPKAPATTTSGKETIGGLMKKYKDQIARALPKHLTPERMIRLVTTELSKNPALRECDAISLFGAVIQCAQLGLEPSGALGHAYLAPYNKNAQLIIGYRGLIELARRSGQIISINAYAVYENDDFEFELGLNPNLIHKPHYEERGDNGLLTYAYAVAELKGGGKQFAVLHRTEIEKVRNRSKASKSGFSPWQTDYEEMAKKTAIRRLFKLLPVSVEAAQAVSLSDAGEDGRQAFTLDGEFEAVELPAHTIDSETGEILN